MKSTTATTMLTTSKATSRPLNPLARSAPLPAPVLIYRYLYLVCGMPIPCAMAIPAHANPLSRRLRERVRTHQRGDAETLPLRIAVDVVLHDVVLDRGAGLRRRLRALIRRKVALADDFVDEQTDVAAALAHEQHAAGIGHARRLARQKAVEVDQRDQIAAQAGNTEQPGAGPGHARDHRKGKNFADLGQTRDEVVAADAKADAAPQTGRSRLTRRGRSG